MASDKYLLRHYASQGSKQAFASLVERHVGLVYGTCYRELGRRELAEEATQEVFLALAKKAGSIRAEAALVSWLHTTALFAAKVLKRREMRNMAREQLAGQQALRQHEREQQDAWASIEPALNDALCALSTADRQAILLRFFEERSLREVGQAMGTNEDAARKRVSRALEKLRGALAGRRAVAVSAVALAALLTEHAVYAVPAHMAQAIAQSAGALTSLSSPAPPLLGGGGLRDGSALNPLIAKGLLIVSTSKIVAGAVGAVLLIALLIGGVHVLRSRPGMGDLQPRTQAAVSKYSLGQVAPLPANAVNPNRWIMNSQGDAVGFANIGTRTLFYYHDGSVSQIPVPPGFDWLAIARITDDGTISCSAEVGQPGHLSQLAVLTGTKDGLSVSASLPTANTYNEIVNEHGAAFCFGKTGPGQFTLFRVAGGQESPIKTFNGQRAVLTAIDSKGDVVGGFRSRQGGWKPFIYSGGNLTLPPMPAGAAVSMPAAISDSGYVVGSSNQTSQGPQTAWLYRDGSVESLGALPGYQGSGANAINNAGVAVGAVYKGGDGGPPTGSVAALFENNHATDLNTLIDPGSGIVLQNADSINDRGQILCDGQQGDKLVMVLLTPAK